MLYNKSSSFALDWRFSSLPMIYRMKYIGFWDRKQQHRAIWSYCDQWYGCCFRILTQLRRILSHTIFERWLYLFSILYIFTSCKYIWNKSIIEKLWFIHCSAKYNSHALQHQFSQLIFTRLRYIFRIDYTLFSSLIYFNLIHYTLQNWQRSLISIIEIIEFYNINYVTLYPFATLYDLRNNCT